jgi:hypothetical protein
MRPYALRVGPLLLPDTAHGTIAVARGWMQVPTAGN